MNTYAIKKEIEEMLGLVGIPDASKAKILTELTENIMLNVALSLFPRIPDEARAEFTTLQESKRSEAVLALIEKHIPDYATVVNATIQETVKEYRNLMGMPPLTQTTPASLLA